MQTKLKDFEVSENLSYELEAVFLEDLEETIQEHLEAYKDTLKHEHHQSEEDRCFYKLWFYKKLYRLRGQCGHFYFYIVGKCFNYMRHFMNNQRLISE